MINYGAYNYVIQDNATMLLADSQDSGGTDDATDDDDSVPVDTTAYQLPPGYEGARPRSQISYGGNDYTVLSNGTMMMCNPGYSIADGTQYQVPPDYAGAGVGSIVNYGGSDYLIGAGVMIKIRVNVNAGYGTTPLSGTSTSTLTRPRTPGSKPGVVNNVRPGTGGSNVHVTRRPNYTGAASPGRSNPGAIHPGWGNHAGAHPGTVPPRGHGQAGSLPAGSTAGRLIPGPFVRAGATPGLVVPGRSIPAGAINRSFTQAADDP